RGCRSHGSRSSRNQHITIDRLPACGHAVTVIGRFTGYRTRSDDMTVPSSRRVSVLGAASSIGIRPYDGETEARHLDRAPDTLRRLGLVDRPPGRPTWKRAPRARG